MQIPSLKGHDRRSVMKEVKLIDGLIHNLVRDGIGVTEVNRFLYAGSYVVCTRLGLIRKQKGKSLKSKKPWWQRRLEKSIIDWRKDLGRIEELRKGNAMADRIRERLDRKYGLTEKGTLFVSTLLENKIHSGSTKIRWYLEANQRVRQNNLFRNNQSINNARANCIRNWVTLLDQATMLLLMQKRQRSSGVRFGQSIKNMIRGRVGCTV